MFWKVVQESFLRPGSRRRALWAMLAVALGTAVAAAMLHVSLDIGDKMGRELRTLGANIVITPSADTLPVEIGGIDYRPVSEGAYIEESSLAKLKEIFWRNNIIAFAPYLYMPVRVEGQPASHSSILVGTWWEHPVVTSTGDRFQTGVQQLNPTWKLEGEPIRDSVSDAEGNVCWIGSSLAEALGLGLGDTIRLAAEDEDAEPGAAAGKEELSLVVKGILTTGGAEDNQIFTSLRLVQSWAGLEGKVRKVEVSALIKPEDELSRRDPATMTPAQYDRWYCSPYLSSILHQIGEVLPGTASRQIRQVAETQGNVLSKLTFLLGMLALLALTAAALSISSIASLTVIERRKEIGLMKALGAPDWLVAAFFLAEITVQGVVGGILGFAGGQLLAKVVGRAVFGSDVAVNWMLLPLMLVVALGVSFAGAWLPLKRAVHNDPAWVLREE
ncbi:MAG: ABC transporter permease [Acidobacteria bacterium]|nr:ABC transporter permease [Acidobacteriota bacterium]